MKGMFVAGVHGVSGEYALSVRKTPIDYNVQRMRKEAAVENENKKLSSIRWRLRRRSRWWTGLRRRRC
jgi:hypothetical protein